MGYIKRIRALMGYGTWLALPVMIFCGSLPNAAASEAVDPIEYKVKAGYLFNFAKFVQWPHNEANATSAFRIGVVDRGEAFPVMNEVLAGKTVQNRAVKVVHLKPGDDLKQCEILFIAQSQDKRAAELLKSVGTAPVLTVGEAKGFAGRGGCINFVQVGANVRFEVNLQTARQAGLKISSKIASMATIVSPEEAQK